MSLAGKRALVTGGAGFIGSHLVDVLLGAGAQVTVLDNLDTGKTSNLEQAADQIHFVQGDVKDKTTVHQVVAGQNIVMHLAANADVPNSVEHPQYDFETNVVGTYNVLRACVEHQVERVISASSAAVYGPPIHRPTGEDHPLLPISPYGASKMAGEALGFAYHHTYGLPFTAIRIFNSYGERQPRYVMYDLLMKLARSPNTLEVLGDGTQVRDFCYVRDTARAFLQAAERDEAIGEAVNIAGVTAISIAQLVSMLLRLLSLQDHTRVRYTGVSWQGDIPIMVADTGKAIRLLGFSPQVTLEVGVTRLIEWLRCKHGWTFGN